MAPSVEKMELRGWAQLAKQGHFHVADVARRLGVSGRSPELHFQKRFHRSLQELFAQWRADYVQELAKSGKRRNEIIDEVGLSECSSLTRCPIAVAEYRKGPIMFSIWKKDSQYF